MGRRVAAGARRVHAGALPRVDRPLARQPRRRAARPRAAALPADRGDRGRRALRRARRARRGGAHRGLRGVGRDLRPGAARDRAARRRDRADHPQRLPAEAARARAAGRAARPGVGIIARVPLASGLLSGRYVSETTFARRRPPHLQPPRRGLRRRRDVLGRRLRDRPRGGPPARAARARGRDDGAMGAALRARSARRLGRDPRRAQPEQARANAARGRALRRSRTTISRRCAAVYDELIRPSVHDRW